MANSKKQYEASPNDSETESQSTPLLMTHLRIFVARTRLFLAYCSASILGKPRMAVRTIQAFYLHHGYMALHPSLLEPTCPCQTYLEVHGQ